MLTPLQHLNTTGKANALTPKCRHVRNFTPLRKFKKRCMRPEPETRLASTFEGQHETVVPRLSISVHTKIPNLLMMR